jgi:hypothetical protein
MTEVPGLDELLLYFESLGDNCEFGLIQRQAGLEPLGLFRFSFAPMASLLRALDGDFAGVADPANIEIRVASNKEFVVHLRGFDFVQHTGRREGEVAVERLQREEETKLKYLIRRCTGVLRSGEKILIRKGEGSKTPADAARLLAALRRFGPATLLWLTEADADHPPGSVRVIADHLLHGRIDHFAPPRNAQSTSFTCWVDVCRGAYVLWTSGAPVGTCVPAPRHVDQRANLLLKQPAGAALSGEPRCVLLKEQIDIEILCGRPIDRAANTETICRHVLTSDQRGTVGARVVGLAPGAIHTFSIWYKSDAVMKSVGVELAGCRTLRMRRLSEGPTHMWQRLEVSGAAPESGVMFPRINVHGNAGAVFYSANWRFEAGLTVEGDEVPGEFSRFVAA